MSNNRLISLETFEACRAGDRRAWSVLFDGYVDRVARWCVLLGLNATEAQDATQEVLATAARRFDQCPGRDALTSWIYQITRRTVANSRRRGWWRLFLGAAPLEAAFEHESDDDLDREIAVRACLQRLSPAHRELLVLMDLEGFTREEAASALRLPAGTIASRLRVAREKFRDVWSSLPQSPPSLLEESP